MKHVKSKSKKEKKLPNKTYIPEVTDHKSEHDMFIDLLSYGRRSFTSKSDIWKFEYV